MRFPAAAVVGTLLAIVALARLAGVLLHEPMLAFANQYDMVRTGACLGLYPDVPDDRRLIATPSAPIARYRLGPPVPEACYPGSEAVFAAAAVWHHRATDGAGEAFPALRHVGLAKAGFAALVIVALGVAFWSFPFAALVHGTVALAVVADPAVSLWLQTLYAEFPILFGLYALVAALAAALLRDALPAWLAVVAALGIALAAFAKEQFFLLPLVLVVVAAPRLWRASRGAVVALALVAAAALAWHALAPRPAGISAANRADAYLGLILPASSDAAATAARLGLPKRCAELAGADWYMPRGEDLAEACPEVFALPGTAFLRLVRDEPLTLARAAVRAISAAQNPLLGNLGVVAGQSWGTLASQPLHVQSLLGPVAVMLPASVYIALVLTGFALLVPAAIAWTATLGRGAAAGAHAFAATFLMLVLVAGYALATSAFGDGLSETARHNLPGFLALAALAVLLLFGLAGAQRVGPGLRYTTIILALAALAGGLFATLWAVREPLALGVVDAPTTKAVPRDGFELRGWALDLSGVRTIRVRSGANVATIPRAARTPSPALARIHGGFPDAGRAGFSFAVPAAWLQQPEVVLTVEAENEHGVVTRIDRRRVRPQP